MKEPGPEYIRLAAVLRAIGHPARLEALAGLRFPKLISGIRLSRGEIDHSGPMSRQAAQRHIDVLVAAGLVNERVIARPGRNLTEYDVNSGALYRLAEQFRNLAVENVGPGLASDLTATITSETRLDFPTGPRLVLVHGLREGLAYSLGDATRDEEGWVIGRRKVAVSLEYDTHVSNQHAVLACDEGRWTIEDLHSKNGTRVNWWPCIPGEKRALVSGDILNVGQSRLVFVS